jgi:putrescine importer
MNDTTAAQRLARTLGLAGLVLFGVAFTAPLVVLMTFGILDAASDGTAAGAYLIAGVAIFLTAASYGRMASIHPGTGSAYTYARRSIAAPVGFLVGWSVLLDYLLLPMMTALLTAVYLHATFPAIPRGAFVVGFLALTTFVNALGMRAANGINGALMIVQGGVIAAFLVLAVRWVVGHDGAHALETTTPFFRDGVPLSRTAHGATIAALSFLGFDAVSTMSDEARDPRRDVPRAVLLVALIVSAVFVAAAFLAQLVEGPGVLRDAASAGLALTRKVGGAALARAFTLGLLAAQLAAGIAAQAGVARLLYAMGRDGVLPPRWFAYVSPRTRTPVLNLALSAVVGLLALVLTEEQGASLVNFGAFVAFTSVNLGVVATWLASRDGAQRGAIAWLVLPLLGAAFTLWLLLSLDADAKIAGLSWSALGVGWLAWLTRLFRRATPALAEE